MSQFQLKSPINAGLVSITFRDLSPEEVVQVAVENGLEGIEWGGDVHVPHGNLAVAKKVARQTAEGGLKVASYGSYYRFEECDLMQMWAALPCRKFSTRRRR